MRRDGQLLQSPAPRSCPIPDQRPCRPQSATRPIRLPCAWLLLPDHAARKSCESDTTVKLGNSSRFYFRAAERVLRAIFLVGFDERVGRMPHISWRDLGFSIQLKK